MFFTIVTSTVASCVAQAKEPSPLPDPVRSEPKQESSYPYWPLLLVFGLALGGCASPQDNARTLLDRIEWQDDEQGCMDLRATVDLSGNPFVTTNGSLILKKSKGENAPEC